MRKMHSSIPCFERRNKRRLGLVEIGRTHQRLKFIGLLVVLSASLTADCAAIIIMRMSDERKDLTKNIDLHKSEWRHDIKKEPILGRNGVFFCIMVPIALIIGLTVKEVFAFSKDAFGGVWGLPAALGVCFLFGWLLLEPILSAVFGLADYLLQKLRRR